MIGKHRDASRDPKKHRVPLQNNKEKKKQNPRLKLKPGCTMGRKGEALPLFDFEENREGQAGRGCVAGFESVTVKRERENQTEREKQTGERGSLLENIRKNKTNSHSNKLKTTK